MKRSLYDQIKRDLNSKIALITGPRQAGKTTLSKKLSKSYDYLNYDMVSHRLILKDLSWDRSCEVIIFDEIHKMKNWKSWIKGIYDVEGCKPAIVVTGSAKLSAFKKAGDSLAGRHFQYRLHPFDLKEIMQYSELDIDEAFKRLMEVGGFPEPFLQGKKTFYNRWKKTHIDLILKEDLIDLSSVRDIKSIELLIELLRSRTSSPVSVSSLARDLNKAPKTVKSWLDLLENLYVIFKIQPFHKNIARSILKESKYYFYDNAMIIGNDGDKLENLVAAALLKESHYQQDIMGNYIELFYLRNKDGNEIDFLITKDARPIKMIEVKLSDDQFSKSFGKFLPDDATIHRLQLVGSLNREKTFRDKSEIRLAKKYLATLDLTE